MPSYKFFACLAFAGLTLLGQGKQGKNAVAAIDWNKPFPAHKVIGNVYSVGIDSGNVQLDFAGSSGLGTVKSEALEQSNVDLANELTAMIESQRGYTANSKVFQTGADLLDVLVNLKR